MSVQQSSIAQELPPIVNYAPADYQGDNQNWMITEDKDQHIYAANNKGLLVFNGAQWELYPSPNETIIRSVNFANDALYSGAYMDFGVWNKNEVGKLVYTSFAASMDISMLEDEQIWQIVPYRDKILFQSFNRLYIYTPATQDLRFLSFENQVYRLFKLKDNLYFQELSKGIFTLKNGAPLLISDSKVVKEEVFIKFFEIDKRLVGLAQNGKFYVLENGAFVPFDMGVEQFISGLTIYSALQLKNGNIVIGTVSEGVFVTSNKGELLYHYRQDNGLGNNTALSLFEDKKQNIWIGLDVGIDCINTSTPFRSYIDRFGEIGATYNALESGDYSYLGTNQGLYYRRNSKEAYKLIEGAEEQVWMLKEIDGVIFCGQNKGTLVIEGNASELIVDVDGAWDIKKIPGKSNLLLQGNYTGLYVLEKQDNRWRLRNKIENFDISSKHFEFANSNTVLVSHEYKGVYEIVMDTAFAKAETVRKKSIDKGEHASLAKYEGDVLYANKNGVHLYNTKTNEFEKNETLSAIYTNDKYVSGKLYNDNHGTFMGIY